MSGEFLSDGLVGCGGCVCVYTNELFLLIFLLFSKHPLCLNLFCLPFGTKGVLLNAL